MCGGLNNYSFHFLTSLCGNEIFTQSFPRLSYKSYLNQYFGE